MCWCLTWKFVIGAQGPILVFDSVLRSLWGRTLWQTRRSTTRARGCIGPFAMQWPRRVAILAWGNKKNKHQLKQRVPGKKLKCPYMPVLFTMYGNLFKNVCAVCDMIVGPPAHWCTRCGAFCQIQKEEDTLRSTFLKRSSSSYRQRSRRRPTTSSGCCSALTFETSCAVWMCDSDSAVGSWTHLNAWPFDDLRRETWDEWKESRPGLHPAVRESVLWLALIQLLFFSSLGSSISGPSSQCCFLCVVSSQLRCLATARLRGWSI